MQALRQRQCPSVNIYLSEKYCIPEHVVHQKFDRQLARRHHVPSHARCSPTGCVNASKNFERGAFGLMRAHSRAACSQENGTRETPPASPPPDTTAFTESMIPPPRSAVHRTLRSQTLRHKVIASGCIRTQISSAQRLRGDEARPLHRKETGRKDTETRERGVPRFDAGAATALRRDGTRPAPHGPVGAAACAVARASRDKIPMRMGIFLS
jgi:hypothetical protein